MKYILRAALMAISIATITPVANAAVTDTAPAPVHLDWANG